MERTILLAEDSPTQAEHLRLLLTGAGYRVDVVVNGHEGLQRLAVGFPDLVISDVRMPVMDGYAFCQAVKASERMRRIPFVLLTDRNTPADIITGLLRGADNFIAKPFENEDLLRRLERIFEHLELRRQGQLDVEITLRVNEQTLTINADKQQMMELMFASLDQLVLTNERLEESQRMIEEHARDLERKVAERTQQLLQTEKLAMMGTLLAGVAHELNNPLAILLGHAALLTQKATDAAVVQRAGRIQGAAERCARIVRNFLTLARQRPPQRGEVSVNQIVHETVELLAYELRTDGVEVVLDLADDLPMLWGDAHRLQQVVVNLTVNAHHAMRRQGSPRRLTFTSRVGPPPGWVGLAVADTGPGIPSEIQARIFEPFFTTKPEGIGTGLGLALCQETVEEHGGRIVLEGEAGQGATFRIELPVIARPDAAGPAQPLEAPPPPAGAAILIVDDETEMAAMLCELLETDGHRVEIATEGAVALNMLAHRDYDVILTDSRMPGLDGIALYRTVQTQYPALARRVAFLTGDVLSADKREFFETNEVPFLAKPFDLRDLRRLVHRILTGPRSAE